jgi:hypothetical protein
MLFCALHRPSGPSQLRHSSTGQPSLQRLPAQITSKSVGWCFIDLHVVRLCPCAAKHFVRRFHADSNPTLHHISIHVANVGVLLQRPRTVTCPARTNAAHSCQLSANRLRARALNGRRSPPEPAPRITVRETQSHAARVDRAKVEHALSGPLSSGILKRTRSEAHSIRFPHGIEDHGFVLMCGSSCVCFLSSNSKTGLYQFPSVPGRAGPELT